MLKIDTTKLLQAEMDRKAFLKNAGIAFAGIIGVTAFVKNINGMAGQASQKSSGTSTYGYGGSVYGGSQTISR